MMVHTSFFLFEGNKNDWEIESRTLLHKQSFFALDPYIGLEYKVGSALRSPHLLRLHLCPLDVSLSSCNSRLTGRWSDAEAAISKPVIKRASFFIFRCVWVSLALVNLVDSHHNRR